MKRRIARASARPLRPLSNDAPIRCGIASIATRSSSVDAWEIGRSGIKRAHPPARARPLSPGFRPKSDGLTAGTTRERGVACEGEGTEHIEVGGRLEGDGEMTRSAARRGARARLTTSTPAAATGLPRAPDHGYGDRQAPRPNPTANPAAMRRRSVPDAYGQARGLTSAPRGRVGVLDRHVDVPVGRPGGPVQVAVDVDGPLGWYLQQRYVRQHLLRIQHMPQPEGTLLPHSPVNEPLPRVQVLHWSDSLLPMIHSPIFLFRCLLPLL